MKIDLSDLKVGDEVFNTRYGMVKILSNDRISLGVDEEFNYYRSDGYSYDEDDRIVDEYPEYFRSIQQCIDYFEYVKKSSEKRLYEFGDLEFTDRAVLTRAQVLRVKGIFNE